MRLAVLEAKIALIELLKRYTFIRAPETEVTLHNAVECKFKEFSLLINIGLPLEKLKLKDFPRYSFHTSAYMKAI